eukprot:788936-Prorocentrum_minimum.AAC.1
MSSMKTKAKVPVTVLVGLDLCGSPQDGYQRFHLLGHRGVLDSDVLFAVVGQKLDQRRGPR